MAETGKGIQKPDKGKDSSVTPLMQQYHEIKSRYPGMILFFRLGDFYEMFGDDAVRASKILEVILTRRQEAPMCGVPYHAVNAYLKKLIKAGEKVAVCEQLEEPGQGRGIVRRDVVRVITPGTILEDNLLSARQNNFLLALAPSKDFASIGLAYCDISTGDFGATEIPRDAMLAEIARLSPGEIIAAEEHAAHPLITNITKQTGLGVSTLEGWHFSAEEARRRVLCGGMEHKHLAAAACAAVLAYIEKTQNGKLPPLSPVTCYASVDHLGLDETVIRNLELVEGSASRSREDSLLSALDRTRTPMGARTLRQWLLAPLLSPEKINERQNAVAFFVDEGMARRNARDLLKNIADIERIISRIAAGSAGPREVVALNNSLKALPSLKGQLAGRAPLAPAPDSITALCEKLSAPDKIVALIDQAIVDEPPALVKDGGVIRQGFNGTLDELKSISRDAKKYISELEARERRHSGITSLKVGYTSVFGYYIEITKANLSAVPPEYIRKQTLTNAERFVTPELKTLEEKILSAEEKILRLETELFKNVREEILTHSKELREIASSVARLDVFASFAETAALERFTRPVVDESLELEIREGRHPVVEHKLKSGSFVPNDVYLNGTTDQIIILTGPNMAGKSTYLRQTALIVLMAQIGSFVPAAKARVGIVDRIFTRIGAADNLSGGESTFMVEMHETAHILRRFTPRSLIILDEVGRGTSTYDGISIARATVEYLGSRPSADAAGPKVLFATHYFELTDLAEKIPGIKNYNVAVKEWQQDVVFLHAIVPGAADRSYGIHVAKLAGMPKEVIKRAKTILEGLEQNPVRELKRQTGRQPELFASSSPNFLIQWDNVNPDDLTPLEALQLLAEWKNKMKGES